MCGNSSVGRALASQAEGRGFESRLPLSVEIIDLMTIILVAIALVGLGLIAVASWMKINKAALAIFVGVLCWMLLLFYGKGYVTQDYLQEFNDFVLESNTHSVRAFIATEWFLKAIGAATDVILYIIATMSIVEVLSANGCFDFLKHWLRTRHSQKLLWALASVTFLMSANLDDFTTIAMMLVVMRSIVANARQRMIYGAVIVIAANCGGALTVIGDINSLLLWGRGVVTPTTYSYYMVLPTLLAVAVPVYLMGRMLPNHIDVVPNQYVYRGDDTRLTPWQRVLMLVVGIGGLWFIPTFHRITYFPPFVGALCVLALVWIVDQVVNRKLANNETVLQRQPRALQAGGMQTVIYFLGICLAVEAVAHTGVLQQVQAFCGGSVDDAFVLSTLAGIGSIFADATALVLASVSTFAPTDVALSEPFAQNGLYWPLLSFSTTLGGSLLTIGSAGGYFLAKLENVSIGWYLRFVTPKVLLGWLAGMFVFCAMAYL